MKTLFAKQILLSALLFLGAVSGVTAKSDVPEVTVNVLNGWREANGDQIIGLEINLSDGWKTYWRAPGDAGIPPRFEWDTANPQDVKVLWPTPQVFSQSGMTSIGYSHSVVIPVIVPTDNATAKLPFSGKMEIGICKDICVPVALDFSTFLIPSGSDASRVRASLNSLAVPRTKAGVDKVSCSFARSETGMTIAANITLPKNAGITFAAVEAADPMIWIGEAKLFRKGNSLIIEADMEHANGRAFSIARSEITITLFGENRAIELSGCE